VLGNENRMPSHRRLPAVVFRLGRRQTLLQKLPPMLQNDRQRFLARSFGPNRNRLLNRLRANATKRSSRSRMGVGYGLTRLIGVGICTKN
jgi:hypothetical protein